MRMVAIWRGFVGLVGPSDFIVVMRQALNFQKNDFNRVVPTEMCGDNAHRDCYNALGKKVSPPLLLWRTFTDNWLLSARYVVYILLHGPHISDPPLQQPLVLGGKTLRVDLHSCFSPLWTT